MCLRIGEILASSIDVLTSSSGWAPQRKANIPRTPASRERSFQNPVSAPSFCGTTLSPQRCDWSSLQTS